MRFFAVIALGAALSGCLHFHTGAMPGEPKNATFVSVDGTRVRYVDAGEGPVVVLLHGFASSIENWVKVMPELTKSYRVIALDLRGFGWTDRPETDYSPEAQAKLVAALLDERGVHGKASIVAHSWGSSVALAFALAQPERVERLALYDAWVYDNQLPSMFHMARAPGIGEMLFGLFYDQRADERITQAFYDPEFISEALVEDVERAFDRPGTRAAALSTVRGMDFTRMESKYPSVKVPTLLLWGREDLVTPVSIGERLLRSLPQSKLVVYPRCGHFPMLEAASESTRDLQEFLGGGK
jgi:pimeloyl-ACP methyl ester carboxylesterase